MPLSVIMSASGRRSVKNNSSTNDTDVAVCLPLNKMSTMMNSPAYKRILSNLHKNSALNNLPVHKTSVLNSPRPLQSAATFNRPPNKCFDPTNSPPHKGATMPNPPPPKSTIINAHQPKKSSVTNNSLKNTITDSTASRRSARKRSDVKKEVMCDGTRVFLQKICHKQPACVDMTRFGFIADSQTVHLQYLMRPLRAQLDRIWGKSNEQGSSTKVTKTGRNSGRNVLRRSMMKGQPMFNYLSISRHPKTQTPMHQERGFLRILPGTNTVALIVSHNFGLTSLEEGTLDEDKKEIHLETVSLNRISFAKPPRVKKIKRIFKLIAPDYLEVTLFMETENTPLTKHLNTVYKKVSE